jgi:hypothetical protein
VEVESVKTSFLQHNSVSVGRCEVEEEDPHKGDKQISQSARVRRPLGGVECIILFSAIPCLMAASKEEVESGNGKCKDFILAARFRVCRLL